MMKLTVAFLAALSAADAAQAHGRRHVRRQGSGYGGGYGEAPPYSLPGTGIPANPSSVPADVESSSAASPETTESAYFSGTGTAPVDTGFVEATSVAFPTTGAPAYPTGSPDDDVELITSTIYATQTFTVTGCPKSVTDCPSKSTSLVTSVVPIATTVCPKPTDGPETPSDNEEVIETSVDRKSTRLNSSHWE